MANWPSSASKWPSSHPILAIQLKTTRGSSFQTIISYGMSLERSTPTSFQTAKIYSSLISVLYFIIFESGVADAMLLRAAMFEIEIDVAYRSLILFSLRPWIVTKTKIHQSPPENSGLPSD